MSDTAETPRRHFYRPLRSRHHRFSNHSQPVPDDEPLLQPEPDPHVPELGGPEPEPQTPRRRRRRRRRSPLLTDPYIRIAMYVAMAHAGLALSLALLFGLAKLLQNYWRPIQWAILCSIPLREMHTVVVSFWSHSLNLGLFDTIIAIPISALNATNSSLIDSHAAFLRLLNYRSSVRNRNIGFSKLFQWLISFGLFIFLYERMGIFAIPIFAVPCFIAYATGWRKVTVKKLSSISSRKFSGNNSSFGLKISRYLTSIMLNRLKTTVGIGLIMFMLVGSVCGLVFFSYKIAMEGKEAVVSVKVHLAQSNYAERIGVKKWMEENHVPELIDSYASKFYETMLQNIDSLAEYYNVTEIVDGVRQYLVSPSHDSVVSSVPEQVSVRPLSEKLYVIQSRVRNGEWMVIYTSIAGVSREFVSLIFREDLILEKIKSFLLQSLDVSKRLIASSSIVLTGGINLLFFMAVSIISGAAGLVNFISKLMVFLWLLYYLITSDSGGVMEHVLGMVPMSKSTRSRCAQVLDHAVSSVLLAAAKVAFFQGCLTYLLFRFYRIHFLYMSTFLALMSAILPIIPALLSSIPAAAQLAMEARHIEAIILTGIHQILLEYGTLAIQNEIPGQNAYLTGLSILGGMALFASALEGAIMGPLLMTVMITLKNLYEEFVLGSSNGTTH